MRAVIFSLFLISMSACASTQPANVSSSQVLVHAHLNELLQVCERMNKHAFSNTNGAQCYIWDLSRMHLRFPNHDAYQKISRGVATMIQRWCNTAQYLNQDGPVFYSWEFLEERATYSRKCPAQGSKEKS